jgi:hypothetical protein
MPNTYSAIIIGMLPASNATDVFVLSSNATTDVYVTRVRVSGSATSASVADHVLIKRSSLNSGGTSTAPACVPHDSDSPAASSAVRAYTANPTLGATVGGILAFKTAMPSATTPSFTASDVHWHFPDGTAVKLKKGSNECLAINLNGATLTGGSMTMSIEWTEVA